MLDAHADVAHRVKGQTCLHDAVLNGHQQMVDLLLVEIAGSRLSEARLTETGRNGWTPLGFAVRSGHVGIARALLVAGANPSEYVNRRSGKSALEVAVSNGRSAMIELLKEYGCKS